MKKSAKILIILCITLFSAFTLFACGDQPNPTQRTQGLIGTWQPKEVQGDIRIVVFNTLTMDIPFSADLETNEIHIANTPVPLDAETSQTFADAFTMLTDMEVVFTAQTVTVEGQSAEYKLQGETISITGGTPLDMLPADIADIAFLYRNSRFQIRVELDAQIMISLFEEVFGDLDDFWGYIVEELDEEDLYGGGIFDALPGGFLNPMDLLRNIQTVTFTILFNKV